MITVRSIHKSYDAPVLRGVDLHVDRGRSLVVIGGSGAGKSVLLRCILGLETPDQGSVEIDGTTATPATRPALMRRFGMLFQGAALFDSLTVWENVSFRLLRQMPRRAARDLAIEKLARVGLEPDVADRLPAALSGGMQKRAALARAIAAEPEILLFDEPTTGLDPIRAATINHLIRSIVDDLGVTAVTITHDMASARHIGDDIAMLHQGRILWHGRADDIDHADPPALRQFLAGAPAP